MSGENLRAKEGKVGKEREKKGNASSLFLPPIAFPCLSLVLISLSRLYSISCSRETSRCNYKEEGNDRAIRQQEGWGSELII